MKTYRDQRDAIEDSEGTKQMKTLQEAKLLLVFIHTKLMNTDIVLAVPHWQAAYSKVFTSVSSDYVTYTPIAFDVI